MNKSKDYIVEYMLIHTELSKREIAKEFKISTATVSRWRKEINYSELFVQNDTPEQARNEPVKPVIETLTKDYNQQVKTISNNLTKPHIQNSKIQYECIRKCYWQSKLWNKGELFFNKDCSDVPAHFRPYDPDDPVRTEMTIDEMLSCVGHTRLTAAQHR